MYYGIFKKKRVVSAIVGLAMAVFGLSIWFYVTRDKDIAYEKENYSNTTFIQMDYPTYSTIDELKSGADYIFTAQALNNGRTVIDAGDSGDPDPIPNTKYSLKVKDVYKGKVKKSNASLLRTGGVKHGTLFTAEDYPVIEKGNTYIVFAIGSDGEYGALAGGYAVSQVSDNEFVLNKNVGLSSTKPHSVGIFND